MVNLKPLMQALNFIGQYYKAVSARFPLTGRGMLCLIACVCLIFLYAIPDADLVAAIISSGFLFLLFFVCVSVVFSYLTARRRISFLVNFPGGRSRAGQPVTLGIIAEHCNLFPFLTLAIDKQFATPGVNSAVHLLRGREAHHNKRLLIDNITFPHRGIWKISALHLTIADTLGLSAISWTIPISGMCEILPPINPIRPLPIIASSTREGDDTSFVAERTGDLFDTKQYDPSDGVKRILWKSYARSRTLIVRRPEPAQIPDGEVAIFLVANNRQDFVAGAAESYIEFLHRNNVKVLFGGAGSEIPNYFTSETEKILTALCATGTSSSENITKEFIAYIKALASDKFRLQRVVIFAAQSSERVWYGEITALALAEQLDLCLVLVPEVSSKTSTLAQSLWVSRLNLLKNRTPSNKTHSEILSIPQSHQIIITETNLS